MNKIRTHIKWISAFMVIVLMMTVMPFNLIHVSATELDTVRFIIDSVSARAGETIEINAVLENAFNVKAISASNIVYDETKVSLINVEWLCDATMSDWNMSLGLGAVTFSENTNANGSVLKMTFRVKESISDSDVDVTCSATVKTLNDTDDEIELNIEIIPGVISIRNPLRGDVDGNGKINTNDAIRLLYFVSFGGTRFPINQNGDMNGDNKVNTNDAVYLLYHVSFGNDRFPLFEACVTHHLVAHVQNAPTCTEAGNSEYWHCTKCGKYFADADGNKEITIESTVVNPKGHTVVIDAAVSPTYDSTGLTEGKHCSVCNVVLVEQQVVPALKNTHLHSITYNDYADADISGLEMSYDERYGYVVPQI